MMEDLFQSYHSKAHLLSIIVDVGSLNVHSPKVMDCKFGRSNLNPYSISAQNLESQTNNNEN